MSTPVIPPFVPGFETPAPNITPFTYRDGLSYLQRLERLAKYIERVLTPWVELHYNELAEAFIEQVEKLITDVNSLISEQTNYVNESIANLVLETDNKLEEQNTILENSINGMEEYVNNAVQDIVNSTIAVSDPVTLAIFENSESDTRQFTDNVYRYPVNTSVPLVSDQLASLCDFNMGMPRVAVASDSTWNDANDMPWKFLMAYADLLGTGVGARQKTFDTALQEYKAWQVAKIGVEIPSVGGTVLVDNFNRNAAELVGSNSSGGQVWEGTPGGWSANGTAAIPVSTSFTALSCNVGSATAKIDVAVDVVTTATGSTQFFRVVLGSGGPNTLGSNVCVFLMVSIDNFGAATLSVWKRVGAVNTQIVTTDSSTGIVSNSATPQRLAITLEIDIQNIAATLKVGSGAVKNYSATILETDYSALGTYAAMWATAANNTKWAVDSISVTTPFTPESYAGLELWNGAVAGSNLPYQQSRMELLYPSNIPFDQLWVSGGHNKATTLPDAFISEVNSFINAFKTAHPEVKRILISSQNPQKAPSPTVAAHAARQAALRQYAFEMGYEYLPVFESFTAQENSGLDLIGSDGIHPTFPGQPSPTAGINLLDWSGSVLWASVLLNSVNSRRILAKPAITKIP